MSDWTIRPAHPDDSLNIASVAVAGWRQAYADIIPAEHIADIDVQARADRIRERWGATSRAALVELEGKGVVGFVTEYLNCRLPGYDVEVGGLYVHPDAGRSGLGKGLMRYAASEWFIPGGARSLAIMTLRDNYIGRSFYESIGGAIVQDAVWSFQDLDYAAVWYGFHDLPSLVDRCLAK